ncbi:MAG: hypothetical protein IPG17_25040 [Sandaracinaceae bacterium]|nr:hypothetical protein [Sandaracinaceae bacterium]MBP7684151.1 hypothetical protein [Deltaproteobacteria bacterium]MBK6811993.1 hypothetical protein [Sandaracinaceae bacterium]MBK7150794.1 hypothetical protein [Sandaracinaceae bacterium]MBK7777748.1 hypothetical protein [Sandaracinaceae bacterium]
MMNTRTCLLVGGLLMAGCSEEGSGIDPALIPTTPAVLEWDGESFQTTNAIARLSSRTPTMIFWSAPGASCDPFDVDIPAVGTIEATVFLPSESLVAGAVFEITGQTGSGSVDLIVVALARTVDGRVESHSYHEGYVVVDAVSESEITLRVAARDGDVQINGAITALVCP